MNHCNSKTMHFSNLVRMAKNIPYEKPHHGVYDLWPWLISSRSKIQKCCTRVFTCPEIHKLLSNSKTMSYCNMVDITKKYFLSKTASHEWETFDTIIRAILVYSTVLLTRTHIEGEGRGSIPGKQDTLWDYLVFLSLPTDDVLGHGTFSVFVGPTIPQYHYLLHGSVLWTLKVHVIAMP